VPKYPWKFSGVTGNGGVDLETPAVDAAGHALAPVNALFAQPVHHIEASDTVVAINDQCGFISGGIEALELSWNGPHGDQLSPWDASNLKFAGLANVHQEELFAGGEAALDLLGRGLEGERGVGQAS